MIAGIPALLGLLASVGVLKMLWALLASQAAFDHAKQFVLAAAIKIGQNRSKIIG